MSAADPYDAGYEQTPLDYERVLRQERGKYHGGGNNGDEIGHDLNDPVQPSADASRSLQNIVSLGPYPSWTEHVPISQTEIKHIFERLTIQFGFQRSSMENMYDHFLTQLDSRASRLTPRVALTSLHASYIGGENANYRKWFFAAQLDLDEEVGFSNMKLNGRKANKRNNKMAKKNNIDLKKQREYAEQAEEEFKKNNIKLEFTPEELERNKTLSVVDYKWKLKMHALDSRKQTEQIALYLLIWGESNQIRYLPECICFIYKCAYDFYTSTCGVNLEPLPEFHFLDNNITPIYKFIENQVYREDKNGKTIRREKDHKDIIGYDDINQLFWYPEGIERIKLKSTNERLVDIKLDERYSKLRDLNWEKAFYKTYKEKRTWLHIATNFNRIWVIHLSSFWFFTVLHSPTLYTKNYYQLLDNPPTPQSKLSAVALGGTVSCLIQIVATLGEWSFVPRSWPGAQHLTKRLLILLLLTLMNFAPSLYTFGFFDLETHSISAYIVSIIQLILAIFTSLFFSYQPLGALFGSYFKSSKTRRYVSSKTFTASFPALNGRSYWFSIILWFFIFLAKFLESYFFLTLSLRDPIRVLSIMDMTRCNGDHLIGTLLCRHQPIITLGLIYMTDLVLFFLDTYLWYIVFNSLFSVLLSFGLGISILSPWRNVYSRLPKRIYSKILATGEMEIKYKPKVLVSQVWNAIIISMYREHLLPIDLVSNLLYQQVAADFGGKKTLRAPTFFVANDDSSFNNSDIHFPSNSEAERRIAFFAQSLSTPIPEPLPVECMPIFTVLIPHYGEKIILSLKEIIREANSNTRMTLLEYLKQLYPTEWECFVKDTKLLAIESGTFSKTNSKFLRKMVPRTGTNKTSKVDLNETTNKLEDVATPLDSWETFWNDIDWDKLKWEDPFELPNTPEDDILQGKINDLPFYYIGFKSSNPEYILRTRIWASLRTQTLYRTASGFTNYIRALKLLYRIENPGIVQYYSEDQVGLEHDLEAMAHRKYKLLIAMQRYASFNETEKEDTEFLLRAYPEIRISYLEKVEVEIEDNKKDIIYYSCMIDGYSELDDNGQRIPKYKIKLSGNPILGDGKSDNQNHSLIFYRGEYIQVVDANQDNYLEECIKVRSVLSEFEEIDIDTTPPYIPGIVYKNEPAPVAIVGAREYIFSENIGVLGDIAAGKEQTFGTLFARTLAEIGGKLHYGHPDFLNGIFMTTRGGISKAQKGLHLNEDIYAGMNALLRGGRIKHCDYYQCGKGRDLGFGSILNFTTKIGAGMGEQILSREYYYLGTQLPLDRFLSFYYAHPGFHINNLFIILSVQLFMIVLVNLGALAHESTICDYDKDIPFTDPQLPVGCYNLQPVLDWVTIFILSVFIVFFISFVPLIIQELTERGIWRAFSRFSHHLVSLSPFFEVFVCQIYATSLISDITFGGARYISTGRGFAVSRIQFSYLYSRFASSSIYSGAKIFLMLLFATLSMWQPALLWFWITLISLCFAPFIFNPHQFSFVDYFLDYRAFIHWLLRGNYRWHPNSWASYVKLSRARYTGYKKKTIDSCAADKANSGDLRRSKVSNVFLTELVIPLTNSIFLFFAYTFMNSQNGLKNVEPTSSVIRLVILVLAPIIINILTLIIISPLLLGGTIPLIASYSSTIKVPGAFSAIAHIISVIATILMFEIIWFLEGFNFVRALSAILCVLSIQNFIFKFIMIFLLSKEYKTDQANRSWWSGNWKRESMGWSYYLHPLREFLVKIIEMSLFSVDFILGHCLLFIQTPLVFIPYIDTWHSMVLFWTRPSKQQKSATVLTDKEEEKRDAVVLKYIILYFSILVLFLILVIVPAVTHKYIPEFEDPFKGTIITGLIQPNKQDNDDTGTKAPTTIITITPEKPIFKTTW